VRQSLVDLNLKIVNNTNYSKTINYTLLMFKNLLFIVLFSSIFQGIFAQNSSNMVGDRKTQYLVRSTLGSSGFSKTITSNQGNYYVSQSVGQSGVIGTSTKNNYTIRQGFQQPPISAQVVELPGQMKLKANVFPNPFLHSIDVIFEELIKDELSVTIYNLSGTLILSEKYSAAQSLNLPLDFLSKGNYIIKIATENKQFVSKIVKE